MFSRQLRLRRSVDVQRVVKFGARLQLPHFKIYYQARINRQPSPAKPLPTRLTVVVSKKTAKGAVSRNRIKRRVRAAVKSLRLPSGFDCVIFPNLQVLDLPFAVILEDLTRLATKLE